MNAIKNISTLLIVTFSVSIPTCWSKTYGDAEVERVISVYDGDTCTVDIKRFFITTETGAKKVLEDQHPIISKSMSIRIVGIDTPEMQGSSEKVKAWAIKARDFVRDRLNKAKVILLKGLGRDKYFRFDATIEVDGKDLGQALIDAKLALPYDGGPKADWEAILADRPA